MAITIKLDDVFNHASTYLIDMNCKLDLLKYDRVIIKIEQDQELHFQQLEGTYKMKLTEEQIKIKTIQLMLLLE